MNNTETKLIQQLRDLAIESADALWALAEDKKPDRDPKSINQDIYHLRLQIDEILATPSSTAGDEVLIKAEVIDFDANPHGPAIKVKIKGFLDRNGTNQKPFGEKVELWIHRLDQKEIIQEVKS